MDGRSIRLTGATLQFVAMMSFTALVSVWYFQLFKGVMPCHLCWLERIPYYVSLPTVVAAAFVVAGSGSRAAMIALAALAVAGLAFAVGAGIGGYHYGMEQGWWHGPSSCASTALTANDVKDLWNQMQTDSGPPCDKPSMLIFGISLAGWNALLSGALAFTCLHRIAQHRSEDKGRAMLAMAEPKGALIDG